MKKDDEKRRKQAAEFLDNLSAFLMDDDRPVDQIKQDLQAQSVDPEASLNAFRQLLESR